MGVEMLNGALKKYCYLWPASNLEASSHWQLQPGRGVYVREVPETAEDVVRIRLRADVTAAGPSRVESPG